LEAAPPPLEGLDDEGFVGLDDARKALGLVEVVSGEKPMPPSEGGARVDPAALGRLGEALPFDQGSRVIGPAILVVQAGHRRAGERIESPATFDAAIARRASRLPPGPDIGRAAVRASPQRMALRCDVPENITLARCGGRRRDRFAALFGLLRLRPCRRPRFALFPRIVSVREREFAKSDTALRRAQRRQRSQPLCEIRRLHLQIPNRQSPYRSFQHVLL